MIPRMFPQATGTSSLDFAVAESRAWQRLRLRFQEARDLWTDCELAHLRFMRWLAQSGRLASGGYRPWEGESTTPSKCDVTP